MAMADATDARSQVVAHKSRRSAHAMTRATCDELGRHGRAAACESDRVGILIEQVDATLGAVVTGLRLAELDETTWRAVEGAFNEHAVLVFPGQHLTEDEQLAFGQRFGSFEVMNETNGLVRIGNLRDDGTVLDPEHPIMQIGRGNEGWHTDSSYVAVSAKCSMLSAHVLPASGGGTTEWADMRAAYDALPPSLQERVESLVAHHSYAYSQTRAGFPDTPAGAYGFDGGPGARRPLVKVHPVTGRKALFIGRHACDIPGMTSEESESFLDELLTFACQPPRLYEHDWTVGDLVLWDNRCVLHRVHPWDLREARLMKHTRIAGDPVTEAALDRDPPDGRDVR
jgi:alpha-ketoglutarate-dependent taurine dioxygenase